MITAMLLAGCGFALCTALFAVAAMLLLPLTPFQAVVLAVPFAVISSAVAIPISVGRFRWTAARLSATRENPEAT